MKRTKQRSDKIQKVISQRQPSLKLVLENIHDPHNVSAIFRTCDAAGIPKVSLIYNLEAFPKIGKKSSGSAHKWIEKEKYAEVNECYKKLRSDGFKIFASSLCSDSKNLYDLNLTLKTAVIFGNEHRGLSEEAVEQADEKFFIPMFGMVQSLNVSVSAAITIYEALRQRLRKGMYEKSQYSDLDLIRLTEIWSRK